MIAIYFQRIYDRMRYRNCGRLVEVWEAWTSANHFSSHGRTRREQILAESDARRIARMRQLEENFPEPPGLTRHQNHHSAYVTGFWVERSAEPAGQLGNVRLQAEPLQYRPVDLLEDGSHPQNVRISLPRDIPCFVIIPTASVSCSSFSRLVATFAILDNFIAQIQNHGPRTGYLSHNFRLPEGLHLSSALSFLFANSCIRLLHFNRSDIHDRALANVRAAAQAFPQPNLYVDVQPRGSLTPEAYANRREQAIQQAVLRSLDSPLTTRFISLHDVDDMEE